MFLNRQQKGLRNKMLHDFSSHLNDIFVLCNSDVIKIERTSKWHAEIEVFNWNLDVHVLPILKFEKNVIQHVHTRIICNIYVFLRQLK